MQVDYHDLDPDPTLCHQKVKEIINIGAGRDIICLQFIKRGHLSF